jgi:hypothetical protein
VLHHEDNVKHHARKAEEKFGRVAAQNVGSRV